MIRKQVYIEERHDRMLKRRAKQRGVTEAEIVRDALETIAIGGSGRARQTPDPVAGRKAVAFMRSLRARRRRASAGRRWTRESLYQDRIDRWTKS
ncbi:MAG TPA: hypothetical protein VIF83_06260 [Gemmatimonadaceae bacterium]